MDTGVRTLPRHELLDWLGMITQSLARGGQTSVGEVAGCCTCLKYILFSPEYFQCHCRESGVRIQVCAFLATTVPSSRYSSAVAMNTCPPQGTEDSECTAAWITLRCYSTLGLEQDSEPQMTSMGCRQAGEWGRQSLGRGPLWSDGAGPFPCQGQCPVEKFCLSKMSVGCKI